MKTDYHDRVQTTIFQLLKKDPDGIIWTSFKSDEELQQWINDAARKEHYEAAAILKRGLDASLHKSK